MGDSELTETVTIAYICTWNFGGIFNLEPSLKRLNLQLQCQLCT
jgi:hypothetical protein